MNEGMEKGSRRKKRREGTEERDPDLSINVNLQTCVSTDRMECFHKGTETKQINNPV